MYDFPSRAARLSLKTATNNEQILTSNKQKIEE